MVVFKFIVIQIVLLKNKTKSQLNSSYFLFIIQYTLILKLVSERIQCICSELHSINGRNSLESVHLEEFISKINKQSLI